MLIWSKIINKMLNYFKILQLDTKLDIDLQILEKKYLELQLKYHPDLLINQSQNTQLEAQITTSNINNAYETLKDPLKRAIHLLEINNIFIDNIHPDPEILMEIMEIKEELENEQDQSKINKIKETLAKRKVDIYKEIINLTNNGQIDIASKQIILLKYLTNI